MTTMTRDGDNWFWDYTRQVHVDFHMPEFPVGAIAKFDAQQFVQTFVRARANVIGVFTKCHFGNAFYDNEYGHKHNGLKGDFFGEVLAEARKYDLKVIAYYSLGTDAYAVTQNPDWYQIDENGNVRGSEGTVWELPCLNSPYREELVIPQVREITEKYVFDGYLFDIPYQHNHTCFCAYCRKKFREETGRELTTELYLDEPETVRDFGRRTAIRTMQEIRELVKAIRPEVLVNCNGAWRMGEPEELNLTSDYGLWESQPSATGTFYNHSIRARHVRTLDVPVQIMTVRFTEGWGLMSCKTPEQLKYEFATILANGGIVNIGDQVLPDGTLQQGVYDVIGEAFDFVEQREAYCLRARSVAHIALIGTNTTNWYHDKDDASTFGAAKMLLEGHHQFDIYCNSAFPELDGYKVVVLPETVELDEAAQERIRRFVARGGLLLAEGAATLGRAPVAPSTTGAALTAAAPIESASASEVSVRGSAVPGSGASGLSKAGFLRFGLADVFGVEYRERTPYPFAYMTEDEELWQGIARIPQLVEEPFLKVAPTTAKTRSRIQWPLTVPARNRAFRHPLPPAGLESDYPAITVNRYGEGTALYIAAPVFRSYWHSNHFWVRRIVGNLLNAYDMQKPFTVEAPAHVEANLMERGDDRFLHLIQYQSVQVGEKSTAFYAPIETITPMHDIGVTVRDSSIKQAVLQPEGLELPLHRTDDGVAFTVPKLHIHAIVQLKR
jgi:hypothetical protein